MIVTVVQGNVVVGVSNQYVSQLNSMITWQPTKVFSSLLRVYLGSM